MTNKDIVIEKINSIKYKHKYAETVKSKMIQFYTVDSITQLEQLNQEHVKNHNYKLELKNKCNTLAKVDLIEKMVTKLERHTYAPEMNCLHFKSGKTFKTPQKDTLESAVSYMAFKCDKKTIETYKTDLLAHFRQTPNIFLNDKNKQSNK